MSQPDTTIETETETETKKKEKPTPPGAIYHMRMGSETGAIDVQTPRGGLTCYYRSGYGGESVLYSFSLRNPADFPTIRGLDTAIELSQDKLDVPLNGYLSGTTVAEFDLPQLLETLVAVIKRGDMRNVSWWCDKAAGNVFGLIRAKISGR